MHANGIDAVTWPRRLAQTVRVRVQNDEERGVVLVLVALLMVLLLVFAALVIDIGNVGQERRQAQNAADAAALAGANDIQNGDVNKPNIVTLIKNYVASNYGTVNWASCTDSGALAKTPDTPDTCISWDVDPPSTTKVRVALPSRSVQTTFGRVIGVTSFSVSANAVATVGQGNVVVPAPCALCTLAGSNTQNGTISVTGGPINIDGNLSCGPTGNISTSGTPPPPINVDGTAPGPCSMSPSPTASTYLPDPLASLPANPDYSGLTTPASGPDCNSGTISSGIFRNISSTCNLNPGLYVVTGTFGGSGSGQNIVGHGVTIFFACGNYTSPRACNAGGELGGTVNIGGSGTIDVTACATGPCAGNAYPGMVLWFDRNDTGTMSMGGTGTIGFVGTVYGASLTLSVNGTPHSGTGGCTINHQGGLCSEIVVNNVSMSGQGTLNVSYQQNQNVQITRIATIPQLLS